MEEIINQRNISIPNTRIIDENIKQKKKKKTEEMVNKISDKFFIQLFFCIILLSIICVYKLLFFDDFSNLSDKYNWLLKYNMTYNDVYNKAVTYLNKEFSFNIPIKENQVLMPINSIKEKADIQNNINNEVINQQSIEVSTGYSNMQILADEIKGKYTLIRPCLGNVSCSFGNRDPSNKDISTFHLGIDLANDVGTDIISAMDGKVLERQYNSTYGNYLKIVKDDIMIVYAHCSKLLVNEGDNIKQGQKIALMGQTGLATGPHLHFEVRKNNMVVNPEYLLDF